MTSRRTDFLHAPKFGWRLTILPLIVIPAMIYLNVGLQASPSVAPAVHAGLAVPAPINATGGEVARGVIRDDAHGTSPGRNASHEGIVSETAGSIPVPVAPVQGVTGSGSAFICPPPKWPVLEFCWFLTKERR
jgi:hypothetical protein